jgi:hypothetical protein
MNNHYSCNVLLNTHVKYNFIIETKQIKYYISNLIILILFLY